MCLIGKMQLLCMQCRGIGPHLVARGKSHGTDIPSILNVHQIHLERLFKDRALLPPEFLSQQVWGGDGEI